MVKIYSAWQTSSGTGTWEVRVLNDVIGASGEVHFFASSGSEAPPGGAGTKVGVWETGNWSKLAEAIVSASPGGYLVAIRTAPTPDRSKPYPLHEVKL